MGILAVRIRRRVRLAMPANGAVVAALVAVPGPIAPRESMSAPPQVRVQIEGAHHALRVRIVIR